MISSQEIKIGKEKIKAIKIWPKSKSVKDIQVFLGFVNLYKGFIKNFRRISVLLTLILQITSEASNIGFINAKVNDNKQNQEFCGGDDASNISEKIKNLLRAEKSKILA